MVVPVTPREVAPPLSPENWKQGGEYDMPSGTCLAWPGQGLTEVPQPLAVWPAAVSATVPGSPAPAPPGTVDGTRATMATTAATRTTSGAYPFNARSSAPRSLCRSRGMGLPLG